MRVSFLLAAISGIILIFGTILTVLKYKKMEISSLIIIILLLAIGYGVHGIQHFYEERYYNFNPLAGKWKVYDEVQKL